MFKMLSSYVKYISSYKRIWKIDNNYTMYADLNNINKKHGRQAGELFFSLYRNIVENCERKFAFLE